MLVATDVLSEGQNLQDAAIVINYDLPWAIIRLIQRAGRIDQLYKYPFVKLPPIPLTASLKAVLMTNRWAVGQFALSGKTLVSVA